MNHGPPPDPRSPDLSLVEKAPNLDFRQQMVIWALYLCSAFPTARRSIFSLMSTSDRTPCDRHRGAGCADSAETCRNQEIIWPSCASSLVTECQNSCEPSDAVVRLKGQPVGDGQQHSLKRSFGVSLRCLSYGQVSSANAWVPGAVPIRVATWIKGIMRSPPRICARDTLAVFGDHL